MAMTLHDWQKILRYFVFVVNVLLWFTGLFLLGLAIFLRFDPTTDVLVRATYSDGIIRFHYVCFAAMVAGLVITMVAFLGGTSSLFESKTMSKVFLILFMMLFIAEITCCIWGYFQRDKVKENVVKSMEHFVKNNYGKDIHSDQYINIVQTEYNCCGASSAADWAESEWVKSNWSNNEAEEQPLPKSCCLGQNIVTQTCFQRDIPKTDGCATILTALFDYYVWLVKIAAVGYFVYQFIILGAALAFVIVMHVLGHGGYKS